MTHISLLNTSWNTRQCYVTSWYVFRNNKSLGYKICAIMVSFASKSASKSSQKCSKMVPQARGAESSLFKAPGPGGVINGQRKTLENLTEIRIWDHFLGESPEVNCSSLTNTSPISTSSDIITTYVPRAFQRAVPHPLILEHTRKPSPRYFLYKKCSGCLIRFCGPVPLTILG